MIRSMSQEAAVLIKENLFDVAVRFIVGLKTTHGITARHCLTIKGTLSKGTTNEINEGFRNEILILIILLSNPLFFVIVHNGDVNAQPISNVWN